MSLKGKRKKERKWRKDVFGKTPIIMAVQLFEKNSNKNSSFLSTQLQMNYTCKQCSIPYY